MRTMGTSLGFLPTAYLPRAHPALARAWRIQLKRKRLDAIFLSDSQIPMAKAMGWEEYGKFERIAGGWANCDTLADVKERCDVSVLLPGDPALYANCLRAAERTGTPTWITWQESGLPVQRLQSGPLVAELQPSGTPNYSAHSSFEKFWEEVDRNRCFTWVLRLDAIGDLLLTVSYLYAFKRQNPKRRIGLVVRKEYVKWLRRLDCIDEICGVDTVYWEHMLAGIPRSEGRPTAWMNLMPGMLRVAGNRILSGRDGLKASAYPDGSTHCEFSPGRSVMGMRELFGLVFNHVKPELPIPYPRTGTDNSVWFSPFPGADERLWPPDAWARALSPLAGKRIILQPSSKPLHRRWHSEFLKHAVAQGLKVESAGPTASIFELVQRMASSKAWVGINSAPMHAAALLGLPAVALGLPWEINARWRHPELQIVAAEGLAIQIQQSPTPKNLHEFVLTNCRQDDWADGLYLDPELFASALRQHPMMKLL